MRATGDGVSKDRRKHGAVLTFTSVVWIALSMCMWVRAALPHGFLIFAGAILLSGWLGAQSQQQRNDWDLALVRYQNQILKNAELPKDTHEVHAFLEALEVDARDRKELSDYAHAAQAVHNDYYYNKFTDLAGKAQINGNDVLKKANANVRILAEEPCEGYHCWVNWGVRVKMNGPVLYKKARELKFDAEITLGQVRKLLNLAMDKMESQGPWVDGEASPNAETELYAMDSYVRQACPSFSLEAEYDRAREIMSRYVKDTLCLNTITSHKRYHELAEQYKLSSAIEYIDGFYGTLKGTVHVVQGGGNSPAEGAHVVVTDPKDQTTWETDTNAVGMYTIKKALLHADKDEKGRPRCPQFRISATLENCHGKGTFAGTLTNPNPDEILKKDVTMTCGKYDAFMTIMKRETESRVSESSPGNSVNRKVFDGLTQAFVFLTLTQDSTVSVPGLNENLESYHVTSFELESFQKQARSESYSNQRTEHCFFETTTTTKELGQQMGFQLEPTSLPLFVLIHVDAKTQKAKKVEIAGMELKFQNTINVDVVDKSCMKNSSNHRTSLENGVFSIGPVQDAIPDPTFNPNALPDFLRDLSKRTGVQIPPIKGPKQESIRPEFVVTSGDGKGLLEGEGQVLKEKPIEDGNSRVEKTYRWIMLRRKKR